MFCEGLRIMAGACRRSASARDCPGVCSGLHLMLDELSFEQTLETWLVGGLNAVGPLVGGPTVLLVF